MSEPLRVQEEAYEGTPLRSLDRTGTHVLTAICFLAGLFHIVSLLIYPIDPTILRSTHLALACVVVFILFKPARKVSNRVAWYDILLAFVSVLPAYYISVNLSEYVGRYGVAPTDWDVLWGFVLMLMTMEITRRTSGWALPIIALCFLAYAFLGPYMPAELWHKGYSLERVITYMFSSDGIYSTALSVSATYVIMFVMFGSFLERSGGMKFFIDFSYSLTGRRRGGPAKVALIASGCMGTISGTSVGNVATVGAFTIPLMKRVGYSPQFSAAVEAAASTGGQIMPPVMGAAAFMMADFTGISYSNIALAAAIPAILYYVAVYFMIDLEALRLGLTPKKDEEIPALWGVLKSGLHLMIPIAVLVYSLVVLKNSPLMAGALGMLSAMVLSWFSRDKERRLGIKNVYLAIANAFKGLVNIAATCATAGIVVGVFALTGLGAKISDFLINAAFGNIYLLLFYAMIVCIILGLGLPTVASYAIAASTVGPALINLGIDPLPAHLFLIYYSSLSVITPPIALSAFAAAAIAGSEPQRTGWQACKLSLTAFLVPFMFVFGEELLFQGNWLGILWAFVTACVGVYMLAAAIVGYLRTKANALIRLLCLASSILMMMVGFVYDVLGIMIMILVLWMNSRKKTAVPNNPSVA